jgi:hypothetical protein
MPQAFHILQDIQQMLKGKNPHLQPSQMERANSLYRFELNSFYNKQLIVFLDPLVLQGIQ